MEWDGWEGSLSSELVFWRALIFPPLTQGPGLLPLISDRGLTLVFGGRHGGWLTLSPYACPVICNCDRWQPRKAAYERGQGSEKTRAERKSCLVVSDSGHFWVLTRLGGQVFLWSPNTGWALSLAHHAGLWEHGCSGQLIAIYMQGIANKFLKRRARML